MGKVAVSGGVEEVIKYITKRMLKEVWKQVDQKYSVTQTMTKWGHKVSKKIEPHTLKTLANRRVASLFRLN